MRRGGLHGLLGERACFGTFLKLPRPEVTARIRQIEAAAARAGTYMGAFVGSVEGAGRLVAAGYRYLAVSGRRHAAGERRQDTRRRAAEASSTHQP